MHAIRLALLSAGLLLAVPALSAEAPKTKALPPGRVEVTVADLHCATCAKKVARKLYSLKGVKRVNSSLKDDLVVVTMHARHQAPVVKIWSAVAAAEIPPVEIRYADQRLDAEKMKPLLTAAKAAAVPK
ncbi:Heavy-metal-associated domain protein [Planctomycetes bacterium MalM25]|nr:Heavy-metal-associated domain protein [Planctomycetes bacterium MalM25]